MTFDPTKTARLLAMFDSGLTYGPLKDWAAQLRGALAMVPVVEAAAVRVVDTITVGNCAGCVFLAFENSCDGIEGEHRCGATGSRSRILHYDLHLSPPHWCPLRAAARLVQLRTS